MKLFYAPNTISMSVAIALREAGLGHELTRVDFTKAEQTSDAYLAKNPKGRVPTLIVGDKALTETGALLEYIAALVPEKKLVPTDPLQAFKMRGSRWADQQTSCDDMTSKVPQTMGTSASYIEDECLQGPFILGDTFCVADIYLFNVCTWLPGDGVEVKDYPKLAAHMAVMETRASVQKIRELGILT